MIIRRAGQPAVKKDVLYRAVADHCIDCMGGEEEEGYRVEIANCTCSLCKLKPFRPYQHLVDPNYRGAYGY